MSQTPFYDGLIKALSCQRSSSAASLLLCISKYLYHKNCLVVKLRGLKLTLNTKFSRCIGETLREQEGDFPSQKVVQTLGHGEEQRLGEGKYVDGGNLLVHIQY